jgi:hypothetical protein
MGATTTRRIMARLRARILDRRGRRRGRSLLLSRRRKYTCFPLL